MAEITAALVKELRERTGLGMMDCKKALTAANGDIEKAIDDMRAAGAIKAAKKAGNTAAEGAIGIKIAADNKSATMVEVNSQTDFLALQADFKAFVANTLEVAVSNPQMDVAELAQHQEEARLALVAKTGENISIRRLARLEGVVVGGYLHGHRIGVLVALSGGTPELAKDIAMHVAAANPQVLNRADIGQEILDKEKEIFLALNAEKIAGKAENIVANMVQGRLNKFLSEVSLVEQAFVKDPDIKIGDLAKKSGAEVLGYVRFEVGEGIDKNEVDFAAEVAAQVAASKKD